MATASRGRARLLRDTGIGYVGEPTPNEVRTGRDCPEGGMPSVVAARLDHLARQHTRHAGYHRGGEKGTAEAASIHSPQSAAAVAQGTRKAREIAMHRRARLRPRWTAHSGLAPGARSARVGGISVRHRGEPPDTAFQPTPLVALHEAVEVSVGGVDSVRVRLRSVRCPSHTSSARLRHAGASPRRGSAEESPRRSMQSLAARIAEPPVGLRTLEDTVRVGPVPWCPHGLVERLRLESGAVAG